jgi:hypothetical protein
MGKKSIREIKLFFYGFGTLVFLLLSSVAISIMLDHEFLISGLWGCFQKSTAFDPSYCHMIRGDLIEIIGSYFIALCILEITIYLLYKGLIFFVKRK